MPSEAQLRADIVEVGRRLYARGYTASNDGNISVRLDAERLLMTPTNVCKGFMNRADDGASPISTGRSSPASATRRPRCRCTSRSTASGRRFRPSSTRIPPVATAFAVAGIPLDRAVLAEVVTTLGSVPIAEYATPSTKELPEAVRKYVKAHDGMLLANHGALTLGADLFSAYYKMETIEHFANISFVARMLGGERLLSREEVMRLQGLRGRYGIAAPAPICADPVGASEIGRRQDCQVLFAPPSAPASGSCPDGSVPVGADEEIRLTYRELTALIEDAVRHLK